MILFILIGGCKRTEWIRILRFSEPFLLFFFKGLFKNLHRSIYRNKLFWNFFSFRFFPLRTLVLNLQDCWRYFSRRCWWGALTRPPFLLHTASLSSKFFWCLRWFWFSLLQLILLKGLFLCKNKWNFLDCKVKFEGVFRLFLLKHNRHLFSLSRLLHLKF